ncbi:MAG: SurA N-terminal domain-containing protein [Desulfuromonadaceae bacterium]|nr:SurA N-terminal domain-containing protein [Desulfuromonadaceae bacterium]
MLDLIRKKQKSSIVKVVFWAIIATFIGTIFLVWGKGRDQEHQMTVAAEVNDEQISFEEFRSTYSNLYNLYRNIYGQAFTPELERNLGLTRQALNILIDQALLVQQASKLGIEVSKDELVQSIAQVEAFQVEGQFNKEQYLKVLTYQRMTPELFEDMQRRQLLVDKVRRQLQSSVVVSDEDVVAEFKNQNEKVNLQFVPFAPQAYLGQVKIDETALQQYFDDHREDYRVAPRVGLEYVAIPGSNFRDQVKLSEPEIERYYQRHLSEFAIAEQVAAAHILIKVPDAATEGEREKLREKAKDIRQQAETGDFAALARKYSEDKASAANGGDLGLFGRGVMDPAFEQAAFALHAGELSDLVASRFGYHIIRCREHVEAGFKPLSAVRSEVETALIQELSEGLAYERAMDAYNMNRKAAGLVGAAQQLGLAPLKTGLFTQGQSIPAIGVSETLVQRAFAAEVNELLAPVKIASTVYLCQLSDKQDSYLPELSEVRNDVEQAWRRQQAGLLAATAAESALEAARAGTVLSELTPKGAKLQETGLFSRSLGDFVPKIGALPELSKDAFDLTIKQPIAPRVYRLSDTAYVVRLKQLQPADPQALTADESKRLQAKVVSEKQQATLEESLKKLRQAAEITIAPAIMRSMEEE